MESRQQEINYRSGPDDWAELSAWQGYEFWSAQLEAEMAFLSELEESLIIAPFLAREGRRDVQPF